MHVVVVPARLPALGLSPEAEESQYRENDDDCSDPPNDVVHGVLLAGNGKCGRVSGSWTITTFEKADRKSRQNGRWMGTSSSQSYRTLRVTRLSTMP
jgi:hypothetical protein